MPDPGQRGTLRRLLEQRFSAASVRLLRDVGRLSSRQGSEAYLVGGVVRDLLLGQTPGDLDLVVVGDARLLGRRLAARVGGRLDWHERFQTATLHLPSGGRIDLARSRRERYARPAALPRIEPAGLEEDLLRRDFTINALACSLAPDGFGRIVDPCGGRADLRAGRIRVLHGLSFVEDPTRAFRAVRFRTRLGFRIGRRTSELIHGARRLGIFGELSAARLRREIERILEEPAPARAVRSMADYRLWEGLVPAPRPERYLELRRLERLLARPTVKGASRPRRAATILALLLQGTSVRQRERLLQRLRPNRDVARILVDAPVAARRIARSLAGGRAPRPSRLHALCHGEPPETLLLAAALVGRPTSREALWSHLTAGCRIRADIRGGDLLRAGVPSGPEVAAGLEAALRAKLDDPAASPADQLAAALRAIRKT